ncbi:hypothetical protein L228DRAFT_62550 [Xylona heveae TC161]|uniref:L domain-like protein n=1 Tax=Xylona heveae (strain CBS 132557 / TC161) TaxID=1328760 RepID=A0A165IMX0_XYLHT|nr:hypothetical protein L228DRAFT_62550 [Xylona heveae TC161]KZF25129.1 hypothetical protein L228DRAFT_62550 [Xylona heveae TC161]
MNVRLENIHTSASPGNYVSFLGQSQRTKRRSADRDSIHSVSSVRSVMSSMTSMWSNFGFNSNSAAKSEKAKQAIETDLKYLYSAFTKIPCLRLSPDYKARLIEGYEEFPFDSAVPLIAFKNVSALEVVDVDFRQFFGWDRMAEQLRSLTVKRAELDDPAELLIHIVLDDVEKRRRRSSKAQSSPVLAWVAPSPVSKTAQPVGGNSAPGTPKPDDKGEHGGSPSGSAVVSAASDGSRGLQSPRPRSTSPARPVSSRHGSSHGQTKMTVPRSKRSGSGSSTSSARSSRPYRSGSSTNILTSASMGPSKWRFLKHLCLADNSLTAISASSLAPVAETLTSLDLSSNLFSETPDSLATLTSLRALNMSNCMIESLHSLLKHPLPAINALNLRGNRLASLAGIERLPSLERLDLRDNKLTDPTELARLTSIPEIREIWVFGNPFTKTHSNYRVTIFNLFRSSPGYTTDIIIDSTGPSYSERRHLIDRVAESSNVPVLDPPPPVHDIEPVQESKPTAKPSEIAVIQEPPAENQTVTVDAKKASTRRKKGPKRRMVNLSQSSSPPRATQEESSPGNINSSLGQLSSDREAPNKTSVNDSATSDMPPHSSRQPPSLQVDPSLSVPTDGSAFEVPSAKPMISKDTKGSDLNGERYKQKLEALKTEVGNGWLSVLSEEGWENQTGPRNHPAGRDYSPASTIRSGPRTPLAEGQGITSSGRTLG